MAEVLVVEDEPHLRGLLVQVLEEEEGYAVEAVGDGLAALLALRSRRFDVAAVDVAMPGMDGIELCRHVRREGLEIGIVLVTARDGLGDRILGLDSGADDYLVKPFALEELVARIRALLRRTSAASGRIEAGDLVLDPLGVRATVQDRIVPLSVKEFGVLRCLLARPGDAVDRRTLLNEVWGNPDRFDPAIVDQYVSYVRKKLAASGTVIRIETVRGVGYRLRVEG